MQKSFLLPVCVAFLASSLVTGCMGAQDHSLEEQVQQQDIQLKQLQPAQADTWNQLQAMRQELNELKGQIDDLKNVGGAQAVVSRIKKHDEALRQVETSMALNLDLGNPMPAKIQAAPTLAAPQQTAQAPQSTPGTYGQPNVAQMPDGIEPWGGSKQVGQVTAAAAGAAGATQVANSSLDAPSESTWGKATPQEQVQVPQKDLSLALYDAGMNAFNSRNYTEAQRSFSDFLKNYSTHDLVPDAQYYLAECYFQKNQYSDAALAYNEVITKYAKSTRAPGAYLKQGICFSKSGQKAAAQARMQELIKKFPKSPEAARAKNFLKTNA